MRELNDTITYAVERRGPALTHLYTKLHELGELLDQLRDDLKVRRPAPAAAAHAKLSELLGSDSWPAENVREAGVVVRL